MNDDRTVFREVTSGEALCRVLEAIESIADSLESIAESLQILEPLAARHDAAIGNGEDIQIIEGPARLVVAVERIAQELEQGGA